MSLRAQAALDARAILNDDVAGFGWPITITSPDGKTAQVKGFTSDISQTIDPQTGVAVVGRHATIAVSMASLAEVGLGIPAGVTSERLKPWVVAFADTAGALLTFKVQEAMPDRTVGVVVCHLEAYRAV